MAAPRPLPVALLLAAALLAPAAAAHTAVFSEDDRVRGSIGLLNEPTSTYAVTGLDACFTQNTTATPRPAIARLNAGDFTATLRAPSGATHSVALEIPFGRPNCLTFQDPLVLTEPGQYLVDLSGSVNGTTFDVKDVKAGGAVLDRADITFPDTQVPSDAQLRDQAAGLQERIDALQARLAALEERHGEEGRGAPLPAAAWLAVGLAALAALRRMRS